MSAFYDRLNATATRLLTQYGQPWTLQRTTAPGATTSQSVTAVKVDQVRHTLGDSGVEIGDNRLLLAADANPQVADRISAGADSFVVMRVESIQPADTILAWWAWARAG